MQQFKDKNGDEWIIELDLAAAMRIESFDFAEVLRLPTVKDEESGEWIPQKYFVEFINPQDNLAELVVSNRKICFAMVWCCVKKQAEDRGVYNIESFAGIFDSEAFNRACEAFMEELPNFFPRQRTTLRVSISKYLEAQQISDQAMASSISRNMTTENIRKLVQTAEKEADKEVERVLSGETFT